ncbi:uncharacterized protein SAPINGB_P002201 [Magnusiomyces paraingens]|uniref:ATP synthase subunit g, mitochondrial n=1 Tax=Magnusiomyces paraingens TaxID=2606893 RepID=A0A5E8BKM5_9ASCO|nr:uncharacterized protein SAPINGB_P002201 [Saprochaete ingens]VVT49297.1 unnamed protein product [Saprochaete ingens]
MLRPQTLLRASKAAAMAPRVGVRNASSLASIPAKAAGFVNCTIFWAKVVGELAKQVYIKEGLAPPTQAQITSVFELIKKSAIEAASRPSAFIESVSQVNKVQVAVKGTVALVQILGLFSLGEIVGRRHVVGYKHY